MEKQYQQKMLQLHTIFKQINLNYEKIEMKTVKYLLTLTGVMIGIICVMAVILVSFDLTYGQGDSETVIGLMMWILAFIITGIIRSKANKKAELSA